MFKNQIAIFTSFLVIGLVTLTLANESPIKKAWELNMTDIYPTGKLSNNFSPTLINNQLIFGDTSGSIKTLNVDSKEIKSIVDIPMEVENSITHDPKFNTEFIVFYGKYHRTGKYFYCAVDLEKKRISGFVRHQKPMISFGQYSVFEKNNNFNVFSPKEEKSIYRQKTNYSLDSVIKSQDLNRFIFQTNDNAIVQLIVPTYGAIVMSKKKTKNILEFNDIVTLEPNMIADNLTDDTLYYHRTNGVFGQLNTDTQDIIWERKFFSEGMTIKGPYIMGNYLYYLVSKRNEKTGLQKGRLICLNKKTGLAEWTARDMTFTNFGIVHFDQFLMATNDSGELLFLNPQTGQTEHKIAVGNNVYAPVFAKEFMYVVSEKKIIKIENTRFGYKVKLFFEDLMSHFQ